MQKKGKQGGGGVTTKTKLEVSFFHQTSLEHSNVTSLSVALLLAD